MKRFPALTVKSSVTVFGAVLIGISISVAVFAPQVVAKTMNNKAKFVGVWQGNLEIGQGMKMPLVFHFNTANNKISGTMDSPAQGKTDIVFDTVEVDANGHLRAHLIKAAAAFGGHLDAKGNTLSGTWVQSGKSFPISFKRTDKYHGPDRSQEPKPPFPYKCEEVKIENGAVTLAGTLTIPVGDGPFPAVILIHGSGPHDRDETIFGHKPFLVISDHLTRRNIAVLRYDKRGCGQSTGDYKSATSKDFAADAQKAYEFLKTRSEIKPETIGLLGHSEGGVVAPMVAVTCPDVKFVVLMAASILPGDHILMSQVRALLAASGAPPGVVENNVQIARETYDIVKSEKDDAKAIAKIKAMRQRLNAPEVAAGNMKPADRAKLDADLKILVSPWYRFFISYDPRPTLEKVQCPILAINGERDTQVIPQENLSALRQVMEKSGNKKLAVVLMPGLNHLLQTCKTGLPSEYSGITETISPRALRVIRDWIEGTAAEKVLPSDQP